MGLFDTAFSTSTSTSTLSPAEAVAGVALIAIASDGYVSDDEANSLVINLSRMQLFKSYPSDVTRRMFDKLGQLVRQYGVDNFLQLAKVSLPFELTPTVFAIATDLVLNDGTVTSEEQAFLEKIYQVLEVPHDVAIQIIQVMTIKNRG